MFASLSLLVLLAGCAAAQRLPRIAVPESYRLNFGLNFTLDNFAGTESIQVQVLKPTTQIVLNAVNIDFRQASIGSGGVTQTASISLDEAAETATLAVDKAIPAGPATIRITYTGDLGSDLRGFYLSRDKQGHKYAVTQFEATDARRAFPSFDEPEYKAVFTVTVTAPREMAAISNTAITSDSPGPGEAQHTVRFAPTPKISTYLVAIVVGDLEYVEGAADGIPIRVYTTPGKKQLGTFSLEAAENILRYYDRYFSIRYPYRKLDLIGLPDFSAGAMENVACITFRESYLLLDQAHAALDLQKKVASVVAHEMAHQWFGDLVTMQWWNDVWLNEGLASWMSTKPVEAWKPQWNLPLDDVHDMVHAMDIDSLANTRPIRQEAETPAEILGLFDVGIEYDKTAAVLRMVESYTGEADFRRGVNAYLKAHAYGNATAEDFWQSLARASHKPVDAVMASFVDQPGIPMVSVQTQCTGNSGKLLLRQDRYFYDRSRFEAGNGDLWKVPVCVKMEKDGAAASKCELLTSREASFALPGCAPALLANANARGYYRSQYPPEMASALAGKAESSLNPAERILLLSDFWAAVRVGKTPIGDYLHLVEGMGDERSRAVMHEIAGGLNYIGTYLVTNEDRVAYSLWVRRIFSPAAKRLGLSPQAEESPERRNLRAEMLQVLGGVGHDPEVLAEARRFTRQALQQASAPDPELAPVFLMLAAQHGDAALYEQMLDRVKTAKTPEEYDLYLKALAQFSDPALLQRTLEFALSPGVRSQDTQRVIASVMRNPAGRELSWDFIRSHWRDVAGNGGAFASDQLILGAASFCNAGLQSEVRNFFSGHEVLAGGRLLKQSLEQIGYCSDLKAQQQEQLRAWLRQQGEAGFP
jgi:aminopeptidase N/puromycin-sensitive aminopeptidase